MCLCFVVVLRILMNKPENVPKHTMETTKTLMVYCTYRQCRTPHPEDMLSKYPNLLKAGVVATYSVIF